MQRGDRLWRRMDSKRTWYRPGLVETVAHLKAAQYLDPEVTFVLDIGGQDMKAMTVQDGKIINIAVNEACSSGCGTLLKDLHKL